MPTQHIFCELLGLGEADPLETHGQRSRRPAKGLLQSLLKTTEPFLQSRLSRWRQLQTQLKAAPDCAVEQLRMVASDDR
jgi:hypothetical protein